MALAKRKDMTSEFSVTSVEKTDPPDGCKGENWYRYVIERENSTIVGSRIGTLKQVTRHAREFADELNLRSKNGGRSIWAPNRKKQ